MTHEHGSGPVHLSQSEFRRLGHAAVDAVAAYWDSIESLPVSPAATGEFRPGDLLARLPEHPPEAAGGATDIERALGEIGTLLMPGLVHWQSPQFYGYFPCNASGPAIIGELIAAGLGQQGMLWSTSPACTELEIRVLDWMAELFGLPASMRSTGTGGGVIHGTASEATLTALVAARHRARRALRRDGDPRAAAFHPTIYTSGQAHSSIVKAAMVAGLAESPEDRTHVRLIAVDHDLRLRADDLARALREDVAAGRTPIFIAATMGTTGTTACDPLREIAIAAEVGGLPRPWLHCDGAHAGSCLVCPEMRWMADGLDRFDSLCVNPHKWLLTNFDCDCFFVADREALIGALSITPEYLRNAASDSGAVIDYRDWQVPLGRRFRALKLWLVIRHYGAEGLRAHVREHVRIATLFESWVRADDRFEVCAPRTCNLVCFRLRGPDDLSRRLMDGLNAGGGMLLSHTIVPDPSAPGGSRLALRLAIGGTLTREHHVAAAWARIRERADAVATGAP